MCPIKSVQYSNIDNSQRPQVNKLSEFLSGKSGSIESHKVSTLRAIACSIYEEYLSQSGCFHIRFFKRPDSCLQSVYKRSRNEISKAPSRLELDEQMVYQLKHALSNEKFLSPRLVFQLNFQTKCFNNFHIQFIWRPAKQMFQFAQLWCNTISWIQKFQVLYRNVFFVDSLVF